MRKTYVITISYETLNGTLTALLYCMTKFTETTLDQDFLTKAFNYKFKPAFFVKLLICSLIFFAYNEITFATTNEQIELNNQVFNKKFTTLKADLNKKITKTEHQLQQLVLSEDTTSLNAESIEIHIEKLKNNLSEFRLQQSALDRISFYIEQHHDQKEPIDTFLSYSLKKMALLEIKSASPDKRIWKYFLYQGIALKEVLGDRIDVCDFISSYISFSTISNPKSPGKFLVQNNYNQQTISSNTLKDR